MLALVAEGGLKSEFPVSAVCVAGLKVRRPTKHVLWEKAIFRDFSHFLKILGKSLENLKRNLKKNLKPKNSYYLK